MRIECLSVCGAEEVLLADEGRGFVNGVTKSRWLRMLDMTFLITGGVD